MVNAALIGSILWLRRELRTREHWSQGRLRTHQREGLADLRAYAYRRSPFYRRFHRGLFERPLAELPVLTKTVLMENFDEVVADRAVRLKNVIDYLPLLGKAERLLGKYWVCTTSGSTGRRGVFLFDFREWATIIASYARSEEWGGAQAGLTKRMKLAVVSSTAPWHQSARVGASVSSWWVPTLRMDASEPVAAMVEKLNHWQPEALVGYASILGPLAREQLHGRLKIAPHSVFSASEVLTDETRERIARSWGHQPFNVYAATETATVASECEQHRMHLFEDLVITEVVGEQNQPVPVGTYGAKVLVTVLFSRTLPLIRYEMSDSVALSPERCPCGRVFGLMAGVQGRAEETLRLPGNVGGLVDVHPNVFHRVMEGRAGGEWQVVQTAPDALRVIITGAEGGTPMLEARLRQELHAVGVGPLSITIGRVDAIPRTGAAKAPLVRSETEPISL